MPVKSASAQHEVVTENVTALLKTDRCAATRRACSAPIAVAPSRRANWGNVESRYEYALQVLCQLPIWRFREIMGDFANHLGANMIR